MFFIMPVFLKNILYTASLLVTELASCQRSINPIKPANLKNSQSYYLDVSGNDANNGGKTRPWKTITKLNSIQLNPGDTVYFAGGQTFAGSILLDANDSGLKEKPVTLTSTGNANAIIDAGGATALTVYQTSYINILNLHFTGSGRKTGNTKDGVIINSSKHIFIDSLSINGFQKSGLLIFSSSDADINRVHAYNNGFAGILVNGLADKNDCRNISIRYCFAENNPGDPTNFTNHSGNGILVGMCRNVTIEYCSATNNGWDMPRTGNGPVGIWAYEADSVLIQNCISYRNKTSPGANDGGGFDLDGGVTNSTIQYCFSYENQGSGYGIFQYSGAGNWFNNTIRFNISENDGAVTANCAGILIWNSSRDTAQFKNCAVYNNTIYNSKAPAIAYASESENTGFRFCNNIFVGNDSIVIGKETNSSYFGNDWYSLKSGFNIGGITNFQTWINTKNKEKLNGAIAGFNIHPSFLHAGHSIITDPSEMSTFKNYQLPAGSVLRNNGLDLQTRLLINNGGKTFNGGAASSKLIGATD
ncbi:MAG: right-handed parallel beta-helix repeat-containing protein [Bacteroidota bacterium]